MHTETVDEFLKRGGHITVIKPHEPGYISHRTKWHLGGINNNRPQYTHDKTYVATGPGGRIELGRPYKSKSNRYKKPMLRPVDDNR